MQMPDGLTGVSPIIDGDPKTVGRHTLLPRYLLNRLVDIHQEIRMRQLQGHQVINMDFGYHQDMHRSFRIDIPERDGFVGF